MHGQTGKRLGGGVSVLLIAMFAVVLFIMSGCGSTNSPTSTGSATGVKEGGILRIGTHYVPESLSPIQGTRLTAGNIFQYVYPHLVAYDTKQKLLPIVPNFATSWEMSPDGLTWTFHTVPNAKWSDGQPLTSEDVVWTINTALKFASGSMASFAALVKNVESATATDPNTVVLKMTKPNASLLASFVRVSILPKHVWEKYATGDGAQLLTFANDAPIVSGGPFMVTKYVKNDNVLAERNPNWWGPKPHIDGFGVKFFTSQDAEVLALKNGELDMVTPLPATSVETMKAAGFAVNDMPGILLHEIILNSNPNMKAHKELLLPKVRQAIAHALDRQKFIDVAYLGYAQPGASWIPPATGDWSDPSLKPETFDLSLANQLLDQAGCKRGSDDIRLYNGVKMEYDVVFPTDETGSGDRVFQIYQADFAKIGIVVHQKVADPATANVMIMGEDNKYTGYQLGQWSWTALIDPDFMLSILTTAQWGALSDCGYSNPTYDKLYREQSTKIDVAERQAIVYQMQQIIYRDKPYIPIVYADWLEAVSPKWTGVVLSPRGSWNSFSIQTLLEVQQVQ